jgi:hypothetical protein
MWLERDLRAALKSISVYLFDFAACPERFIPNELRSRKCKLPITKRKKAIQG